MLILVHLYHELERMMLAFDEKVRVRSLFAFAPDCPDGFIFVGL